MREAGALGQAGGWASGPPANRSAETGSEILDASDAKLSVPTIAGGFHEVERRIVNVARDVLQLGRDVGLGHGLLPW